MSEIRFSPEALRDLQEIRDYIANDLAAPQSAKNTVSEILKKIRLLSEFPEIGSPLSSVVGIDTDYRFLVCGNYLSFYRFDQDTVSVIRVLYRRRNYLAILFGEKDGEKD